MKAKPNGQARSVMNNRPNVKPPTPHKQVQLPKVLQTKVKVNHPTPTNAHSRSNLKISSPHVQPGAPRFQTFRPQPQMMPRTIQRQLAKPVSPQVIAGRTVQLSMSRVIQRKGKYFIDGKEVPPTTQLTDGRVWSENRDGDFDAVWPLAPYVRWHDNRAVPTAQSYGELGLRPSTFAPPRCVGKRMIVVGIPYRDDSFGISLRKDAMLVRFGTGCKVRILHGPPAPFGEQVDALYIPGAPYDLPNTKLVSGEQVPKPGAQAIEWRERLRLQEAWLKWADEHNKPVLGVCGGSRRLAQFSGGSTAHLSSRAQKMHRGDFRNPNIIKHQVVIRGQSQLGRLLLSGNYRALGPEAQQGLMELVESGAVTFNSGNIILDVNSMHWAESVFPQSARNISLSAEALDDPDRTLEGWERVDRPFWIGVQWHPEYAQTGMGEFAGKSKPHHNIMKGLGQAATEDYAIRVLQSAIRAALAQRELRSRRARVEEPTALSITSSSSSSISIVPRHSPSLLSPLGRTPRLIRSDDEHASRLPQGPFDNEDDDYVPPLRPPSGIQNQVPISALELETIYGRGKGIWASDVLPQDW